MAMKKMDLQRRLDQEEYILGGIRPSSKKYQAQYQKVKDIKTEIESLKEQRLQTSNELDSLLNKVERLEIDYAGKLEEKDKLEVEINILSTQIENERKQNVSELDAKIGIEELS